jgi:hypothetical protein
MKTRVGHARRGRGYNIVPCTENLPRPDEARQAGKFFIPRNQFVGE